MEIIATSVHLIDYENETTKLIAPPEAFEEYVSELISYINDNTTIREFVTESRRTEVVSGAISIMENIDDSDSVQRDFNIIANRLLRKETEAQQRVEHMDIQLQKGSLIQALVFTKENQKYTYLLAKVEHGGFVDDVDFSFKSGFSKDKKTIWKTCIFDLSDTETSKIPAKIYSNTAAKYWWSDFLELSPVINDENNTRNAFKAIDSTMNKMIKVASPYDHTLIRNTFVSWFRNRDHLDYDQMVRDVLDSFVPAELPQEKVTALRDRLLELPEERKFDRQFTPVPTAIKARIKKVYDVYQGIKLHITEEIDDIEQVITAERSPDGTQYIKIKTTEKATFLDFYHKNK